MTYHLAIDVGTTYTAAAVAGEDLAEMVKLGSRLAEIPSVLFLLEDGGFLVGDAAVRRGTTEPDRLVREFKRRLGDSVPILLAGSPHAPQSLTGQLLRWVYDSVSSQRGEAPASTVVTHPANWGPFKLDLFGQAVDIADLPQVQLVAEPEAAAVHYAWGTRMAPGEVVAVYDLGGGTFDVAVLRKNDAGFEVLGRPSGLEHLGGIDFDDAVFNHVLGSVGDSIDELDQTDPAVLAGIARLRRDCVEAKEALSADTVVNIPVLLPNLQTQVRLTRLEFEAMVRSPLTETIAATQRGIAAAGVGPGELTSAVLVGGSSLIPLVGQLVQSELGLRVAIDAHPKHSIALGAAIIAADTAGLAVGGSTAAASTTPPQPTAATSDEPSVPRSALREDSRGAPPKSSGRRRLAVVLAASAAVVVGAGLALLSLGGGDAQDASSEPSTSRSGPTSTTIVVPQAVEPASGEVILFTSVVGDNADIFAIDSEGQNLQQITTNPARDVLPAWSPDRRSIAYTREAGNWGIRIASSNGGEEIALSDALSADARVAWSPDGARLAFVSEQDRTSDLYLLEIETGELTRLTDDIGTEGDPAWSPDGTQIALWRAESANLELWVLDVEETLALREAGEEGVSGEQVTEDAALDADPAWSPDGSQIAFASTRNGNWDLFVLEVATRAITELTDDPADDQDPAWSPDGTRIGFGSKRDNDPEIYVMNADGTGQRNVSNRPGPDLHAAWASSRPS